MTAALIIGIVSMICLTTLSVAVAVLSRQSVSDAFHALERNERRSERHLSTVLDRLMAIDWANVVAMRSVEEPDEGGFIVPEDQKEGEVEVQDTRWGHLSAMRERLDLLDNESELVEEDFDHEGSPRRVAE